MQQVTLRRLSWAAVALLLLTGIIFNPLAIPAVKHGCPSWDCTYYAYKESSSGNCTDYRIEAKDWDLYCSRCLRQAPVNGSVCYIRDDKYCPDSLICRNEQRVNGIILVNVLLLAGLLVSFLILVTPEKPPANTYEPIL